MSTTASVAMMEQLLTSIKSTIATKTSTLPTATATPASTKLETTTITSLMTTPITKLTTSIAISTSTKIVDSTATTTQKPIVYYNVTQTVLPTVQTYFNVIEKEVTQRNTITDSMYNRTINSVEITKPFTIVKTTPKTETTTKTTELKTVLTTTTPKLTSPIVFTTNAITTMDTTTSMTTTFKGTSVKLDTTKKQETVTVRPTTVKFKPKEIWIRPAQKGESIVESKAKQNQEVKHKSFTKKETTENTTPKTIIVSIIPTSVSYASFKKIALSTASFIAQKNNITIQYASKPDHGLTKPMTVQTTTPINVKIVNVIQRRPITSSTTNPLLQKVTKSQITSPMPKGTFETTLKISNTTNSMSTMNTNKRLISSNYTTVSSTTNVKYTGLTKSMTTPFKSKITTTLQTMKEQTTEPTSRQQNVTKPVKTVVRKQINTNSQRNLTTITVTDDPSRDEETFHILTEPEHITAVMGDKGTERSSVDLISVISIAGGVMMAVITVAVVIVMLERCKRPRYEDVRKYNDIRMQVMINDNNDVPPPYVRSIFHTPLPGEKRTYVLFSSLESSAH